MDNYTIKPEDKIDYRYLNLDTKQFVDNQVELNDQIGRGGLLRAIPNRYGQVLIAGRSTYFEDAYARFICARIVKETD